MKKKAVARLDELFDRYPALLTCRESVKYATAVIADVYRRGGKLLICGNGGSAADSQHIVGELMKGCTLRRRLSEEWLTKLESVSSVYAEYLVRNLQGALPAINLVSDSALTTALANDVAADITFAQQVFGLGRQEDALLGISTSGNSINVIHAAVVARALGMRVIGMTGDTGGELAKLCDVCIRVPSRVTFTIQEYHLPVYHAICLAVEEEFFGEET